MKGVTRIKTALERAIIMIDFSSIQNIAQVSRASNGRQVLSGKKEQPGRTAEGALVTDIVSISADAAMKGKVGVFAAALASELSTVSSERIERLKLEYAGDSCPISSRDLADAMIARIRMEGFSDE